MIKSEIRNTIHGSGRKKPLMLHEQLPELKECIHYRLAKEQTLITAGGFEHRSLEIAKVLEPSSNAKAIVIHYFPYKPENQFEKLCEMLRRKSVITTRLDYDRFRPDDFPLRLQNELKKSQARSVLFDISAMSKMAIMLILDACYNLNLQVDIFYAEAEDYGPSLEEYEQAKTNFALLSPTIHVYSGVQCVIRMPRLSSVAMQGQPTAAIAFMSFNEQLIQAMLNSVYPSRLFLVNGRPPELSWRESATAWIHRHLIAEWSEDDNPLSDANDLPVRATSTLDYRETVKILLDLYWELANVHRFLLAPTGSKMQTLGCYLAKAMHPDIHIEYPTPKGYLSTYSEGVGNRWLLNFGKLGDTVNHWRSQERRERLGLSLMQES